MPKLRACDACFQRKIRCDLRSPGIPCDWCSNQNITCKFTRVEQKKVPKRDIAEAEKEIELLEEQVRQLKGALGELQTTKALKSSPFNYIAFATKLFRQNWYYRGSPLFSEDGFHWISLKSGKSCSALKTGLLGDDVRGPSVNLSLGEEHDAFQTLWKLPMKRIVWEVFTDLPDSVYCCALPVIDRALLEDTIAMAYEPLETMITSAKSLSARACLLAAFAMLCYVKLLGGSLMFLDEELCAAKAHSYLDAINDLPHMETLQAMLLLQKYRLITGQYNVAETLHHTACRMACALDGHTNPNIQSPHSSNLPLTRRNEHIRRLFWLCYMADKDLSLLSGMPPILSNDYCDLRDPERFVGHDAFSTDSGERLNSCNMAFQKLLSFFWGDPHLSILKEKIFRLLYSPSALFFTDHVLLSRIRSLDDELEEWRLLTPSELRPRLPSLRTNQALRSAQSLPGHLRSIQLQLEYHHVLAAIHTAVRRLGAITNDNTTLPDEVHSVMHSSIDRSLEACRSTIHILSRPNALLPENTLWDSTFYPLTASLSLFANIILHPLEEPAEGDKYCLGLALEITKKNILHVENKYYNKAHIQRTRDFIAAMLTLASCAISKAGESI